MVQHVQRGKALRDRLTLTDLVCSVSQSSLKSSPSGERKDQGTPALLAVPGSQRATCPPRWAKTGEP